MNMTDTEKLAICMDFITQLKDFDVSCLDTFDVDDVECECKECGETQEIRKNLPRDLNWTHEFIDRDVIEKLKDCAWHIWAQVQ